LADPSCDRKGISAKLILLNLVQALVTAVKSIILELETFYKPSSQKRNISKL